MKALFLTFHGFDAANGISKKIRYQVKALEECGADAHLCYYDVGEDRHRRWIVDDKIIVDFGRGTIAKLKKRFDYSAIIKYIKQEKIDFIYMRSYHNANPFTICMVKKIRKSGAKIVMEIPTYPYDQEYVYFRMKIDLCIDRHFRYRLARALDGIVTFSNFETIFGKRTIRISNGIDFEAIPLKRHVNDISHELHLIGVAEIHFWHGFDRVIKGLIAYYKTDPEYKVYFHIVGYFYGKEEEKEFLELIEANHLEPYITLHGAKQGKELDELFEISDFAIGSLARHRSGITYIKTLKNREYAARGMSFIYSETDEDFDNRSYILKAPADETPVDIERIIAFRRSLRLSPSEIRESIRSLSWKSQMGKVLDATMTKHG